MTKARTLADNFAADINGITAGTGITGGGTSGTVTITNAMATEITAKGDLIVGTGNATFDNLPVGTNGYTLVADSSTATGLAYAAPAAFVGVSCYKSASAQTLSTATNTAITFDAEEFDTDGFHSTATNTSRITIPTGKGGKYVFIGTMRFAIDSVGNRQICFNKNGSLVSRGLRLNPATGSSTDLTSICILDLVATDYVEVMGFQTSGGNLDVSAGQAETRFAAYYLGA